MMKFLKRSYVFLIFLFLYAPIGVLIVYSFNQSKSSKWTGFTFDWYVQLFHDKQIMDSLAVTLRVAVFSAIIATVIGTMAAIGINNFGKKAKAAALAVNNIPVMNPDIITGVSLMLLFIAIGMKRGEISLLLAHTTFNIPYVILSVLPKLRQNNNMSYEAALDLGADPVTAFWKVVFPEIKSGILTGMILAFTLSFDDFMVSNYTGGTAQTLAVTIFSMTKKKINPKIYALSTIMFLTVLILLIIVNIRQSKENKTQENMKKERKLKKVEKILSISMAVVLTLTALMSLSSCGKKYSGEVYFQHWGECFEEELIKEFEDKTNIKVYFNTYDSNETLYSKLKMGGTDMDLIVPSDYMIDRLRDEDMLEKLDYENIPNYVNILTTAEYDGIPFEAKNEYYVPYSWGTVGIIYNTRMVSDPVDSWDILWNEKYKGNILMFNNSRDTLGIALKKLGYSYNTTSEAELSEALGALRTQKPIVQAYVMDEIYDRMENGEQAIGVYYAGDYKTMKEINPDLAYALPKEGTNIFYDGFVIPKNAKNKKEAEMLINFLLEKESAEKNSAYTNYATPNKLAYEALSEEEKNDGVIYPSPEYLKNNTEIYKNLPQNILEKYDEMWTELFS